MSLLDKHAKLHSNASTQIDVPSGVASKIIEIGRKFIPDEVLAGEGRVTTPHVTVKYGVEEDEEKLRAAIAGVAPFTITLDRTAVFVANENHAGGTPVVIEVNAAQLGKLHEAVMAAMGTEPDPFPYVPHITVAYVKEIEAQHFAGAEVFSGITFQATAVILSKHDDDNQVTVPLGKAMAQTASKTVTLEELYPNGELSDEEEGIGAYVSQFGNMQYNEIVRQEYPVRTLSPEQVKNLKVNDTQTVLEVFKDHAEPWQKKLVQRKTKKFDRNRIIVLDGGYIVDGNHHTVAAAQLGQPVQYIDLSQPANKTAAAPAVTPEIPQVQPQTPQQQEQEQDVVERDQPATEDNEFKDEEAEAVLEEQRKNEEWRKKQQQRPAPKPRPEHSEYPLPEEEDVRYQEEPRKVTRTKAFKQWFGKSQVVDQAGKPLMVYHGTTHDIQQFDPRAGNVDNYYGKGMYFTDSKLDAAANYATDVGPDITSRIERRKEELDQEVWDMAPEQLEELFGVKEDGEDLDKAIAEKARQDIVGEHGGATIPVYLSIQNPVYVLKQGGTNFEMEYEQEDPEDEDSELIEGGSAAKLYKAFVDNAYSFGLEGQEAWGELMEAMGGGESFSAYDFDQEVRKNDRIEDEEGNISPGQFLQEVYKDAGFDGIIMDAWTAFGHTKYKNMTMDYDTRHYIIWDATKAKSAIGNKAYDPTNPNITAAAKPKAMKLPQTLHDDGWLTPDGKWFDTSVSEHKVVARQLGFRGKDPVREAIDAGYTRVVIWEHVQEAIFMFKDSAAAHKWMPTLLEHIPVDTENVSVEEGKGNYHSYEIDEAREAFTGGGIKKTPGMRFDYVPWRPGRDTSIASKSAARGIRVYHGTDNRKAPGHDAIYFAEHPDDAQEYGKNLLTAQITPRRTLKPGNEDIYEVLRTPMWDNKGQPWNYFFNERGIFYTFLDQYPEALEDARNLGYDAIMVDEPMSSNGRSILVINPKIINWQKTGAGAKSVGDLGLAKKIMHEFMPVLGEQGLPEPDLKIVNQPRARALGRDIWNVGVEGSRLYGGENTSIELQKVILQDERTLRRILAHELCHHADNLINERKEMERYQGTGRVGYNLFFNHLGKNAHGKGWKAYAQKFNAKYGEGFVTEKSDESYATEQTDLKPYWMLLWKKEEGKIYYSVAARLGPKATDYLWRQRTRNSEYRILTTTDPLFVRGGAGIGQGWTVPEKDQPQVEARLEELWKQSKSMSEIELPNPWRESKEYLTDPEYHKKLLESEGKEVVITPLNEPSPGGHPSTAKDMYNVQQRWKSALLRKKADYEDYITGRDSAAVSVIEEYVANYKNKTYRQKWELVPAGRLQKIWTDYMKTKIVHDEKGMEEIASIVMWNIYKIEVNTILCGHTSDDPAGFARDTMGEEFPDDFFDIDNQFFEDEKGAWRITDYALDALIKDAVKLGQATTAEQKLQVVDHVLSIVHARSDLSSWFVQGGKTTLNKMFSKRAALPQIDPLEHGVSKDYDSVRWVYQYFYNNRIQSMSWKDFQKTFQRFSNSKLFTEVRQNRPNITLEDLDRWMQEYREKAKEYQNYEIEQGKYRNENTSFRDVEQLVLKINQSASAAEIIGEDPMMKFFLQQVAAGSVQSGHPVSANTVGWLRVDFINDQWLLVDEVQSDLINAVDLAKRFITEPTLQALMDGYKSETVKQKLREMGATEQMFQHSKQQFAQHGYTLEKLEEMKQSLANLFKDWAEFGIASLIEIARRQGIQNVAIHTGQSIAKRDPDLEADKAGRYYDQIAKGFGFKKQQLDVGDLQGEFWVRTASKTAGKRDEAVTSMSIGTDSPEFPSPVLIRWEQGMRWRQVLKVVKSIAGEVAGNRVPWRDIHIWKSLWDTHEAQESGWESEKAKGKRVMFDILHNGSYVSVGAPFGWDAAAEAIGADVIEASHKVTPMDDSYFTQPELGTETNAYADIPERVRGEYDVPDLKTLLGKTSVARPKFFYHGTPKKNLDAILKEGLRADKSEDHIEWNKAIYLAGRPFTAANYAGMHGVSEKDWVILQIDGKVLRDDLMRPDDYDFPDLWEDHVPPRVKAEYYNWATAPWQVSLKYSDQVAYLGNIPATAIKAIPTPKFSSLLLQKKASPMSGDSPALPTWYEAFGDYGMYDIAGDVASWKPYEKKGETLAIQHGLDWKKMSDEERDEFIWENFMEKDLEKKYYKLQAFMDSMPFPLTVYRAIDMPNLKSLNLKDKSKDFQQKTFGVAWAWKEEGAKPYCSDNRAADTTYIFRGVIHNPWDVDWVTTMQVNFQLPEEHEIRVNTGAQIEITGYKKCGETKWRAPQKAWKTVKAEYAEGQAMTQHTDQTPVGLSKTLKSDPFAEELALVHGEIGNIVPNPPLPATNKPEGVAPKAEGEEDLEINQGQTMKQGFKPDRRDNVPGQVYLLHFDIDPKAVVDPEREDATNPFHARHYLGWAEDAQVRIRQHYQGQGARLTQALRDKGISFTVARIWEKQDNGKPATRNFERRLKSQGSLSRHCPICWREGLIPPSRMRGKALESVEAVPEKYQVGPDYAEVQKEASADEVQTVIAEINEKYPANEANPKERMLMSGDKPIAFFEVDDTHKGRLRIRTIRAVEPRQGAGSLALRRITNIADKYGVQIELTASPYGDEETRLNKDELQAWYRKNRFQDEEGYDPALGYMIRQPKQADTDILIENEGGSVYGDYISVDELPEFGEGMYTSPELQEEFKEKGFHTVVLMHGIEVDRKQRGKGYGDDLLNKFLEEAKGLPIVLSADTAQRQIEGFGLVDWYQKHGFELTGAGSVFPVMVRW